MNLKKINQIKAMMKTLNISRQEACRLLGYDFNDPELLETDDMTNRLRDLFGMK